MGRAGGFARTRGGTGRAARSLGTQEAEPASAVAPALRDREAGLSSGLVDGVYRYARPVEPAAHDAAMLESDTCGAHSAAWTFHFHEHLAAAAQQRRQAREQWYRAAADADVAVEQQRAAPFAGARQPVEDRALEHKRATAAGQAYGVGRHVHAHGQHATPGERAHGATRATAHVEYRAQCAVEHALVHLRDRTKPALERERLQAAVGAAGQQRLGRLLEGQRVHVERGGHAAAARAAAKRERGARRATARASSNRSTARSCGRSVTESPCGASRASWARHVPRELMGTPVK